MTKKQFLLKLRGERMSERELALSLIEDGLDDLQYHLEHLFKIIKFENCNYDKWYEWIHIKSKEMEINCNDISIACKSILYDMENQKND